MRTTIAMKYKSRWVLLLTVVLLGLQAKAQGIDGTWNGVLDVPQMKLNIVFHFQTDGKGKTTCTMDSPDQGAKGIPAEVELLTADSVAVGIPAFGIQYAATVSGDEIKGTFTQMGYPFPLTLKRGEPEVKRPQTPVPPYLYTTEEVTFTNPDDGAVLSGTLTYPTGYGTAFFKRPVPVVLMVTGSGPQNRDEEIFMHKPFLVIADYLARSGIASLRYDDRGTGLSTGDAVKATTQTFANDAAAGLDFLRKTGKFASVGILGHSEGGTICFVLGAEKKVDFAVSLAGTAVKGIDIILEQNRTALRMTGQSDNIDKEELLVKLKEQQSPWLDYFVEYDPTNAIRATHCPVMAINGSMDMQVNAAVNLGGIRKNLPANAKNLIKEYSGLNHLFQHAKTGMATEYSQIEETISEEVLKDMADWILKTGV
ncbi:MAG: alpha/beta hydrolase [Prevotellaceae bacterium]|nr:alpha/beta hydrolase [Prevotella sp.]MDD7257792.1 alpha/beta hydrolase [Prevotellaceae bacterium]MDY6131679.1 alpha/beta hydrolase [Prevotella sp.]